MIDPKKVEQAVKAITKHWTSRRWKVKAGTRVSCYVKDATGDDYFKDAKGITDFKRDIDYARQVFAKVQKMLDKDFPGLKAKQDYRMWNMSNVAYFITIDVPAGG